METMTISPKFQDVIPKSIRDLLRLSPGQKVQAIAYDNRIEVIPVRCAKELRGSARGIDTQASASGTVRERRRFVGLARVFR
jgi:AbrB family looped-hinge helix DNA binding protein